MNDIHVIDSFNWREFGFQMAVPSHDVLLELISPGSNPETNRLVHVPIQEEAKIKDIGSQLLLQRYSNEFIDNWINDGPLWKLCQAMGKDPMEAQFHWCTRCYLWLLCQRSPSNVHKDTKFLTLLVIAHRTKKRLPSPEDRWFKTHEYLYKRFFEYRYSRQWLHALYTEADKKFPSAFKDFVNHVEGAQEHLRKSFRELTDLKRTGFKLEPETIRQCPYCHKWFEQKIPKNGKLKAYCGEKGGKCFKSWDAQKTSRSKDFGGQEKPVIQK
jgi:hypothetical protein